MIVITKGLLFWKRSTKLTTTNGYDEASIKGNLGKDMLVILREVVSVSAITKTLRTSQCRNVLTLHDSF